MLCDKTPTEQPDKTLSSSNKNEPLGNALTHTSSHASAYNLRWSGFIRKLGHIPATSRRMITPVEGSARRGGEKKIPQAGKNLIPQS
jgi:hypothetical protein